MKTTTTTIIWGMLILASSNVFAQKNRELTQIKSNYVRYILYEERSDLDKNLLKFQPEKVVSDRMVVELMERYPIDYQLAEKYATDLSNNNSWGDIDYANKDRSGWSPKTHPERILLMAKAYTTKDSPLYQNLKLRDAIHRALKFWFEEKMVCPNWWYNEIGVPKTLGEVFLLIEDELSAEEQTQAIEVLNKAKIKMTGQNKVWLSGIVLIRAIMENDIELAQTARNTIVGEAVEGNVEGVKADNSFHQHGPQQQFGNYGAAYVSSMSFWAQTFSGTSLSFDQKSLDIVARLVYDGYSKVVWKGYLDVNGLGRQFFKQSQVHKGFTIGFSAIGLAKIDKNNSADYLEFVYNNFRPSTDGTKFEGLYHFWQSDMTIQRRPQWMASVKMHSSRVIGTESGNGDNMKGYHLADGALYAYVAGDEYNDIFPCWDWRLIPGITCYQTDAPLKQADWESGRGKIDFVGNVNNGRLGMTAMDFEKDGLRARKSWIFTDDYIICMGSGISSQSELPVTTSIDQVNMKSTPKYLSGKTWTEVSNEYVWTSDKDIRLFHSNVGYIVPELSSGLISAETRSGSWYDIMQIYKNGEVVKKDIVTIYLDHGTKPMNSTYQYIILPASTPEKIQQFELKNINTISNTKELQVVQVKDKNVYFLTSYTPTEIKLSKSLKFSSSEAGIFMIEPTKGGSTVYVADPTQKLDKIAISMNGSTKTVIMPDGDYRGTTVKIDF